MRDTHKCLLVIIGAFSVQMILALPSSADSVSKGRDLAETLCAKCHLNEGQGEKQGPMGIPGFRAVAKRPNQTYDHVVAWLKSVPPMMPDHHLTQREISDLADFIMSLRDVP